MRGSGLDGKDKGEQELGSSIKQGKVALVTGGGTGIGRATVLMLADAGVSVAVNYSRSVQDAERTVRDAKELGVPAVAVHADVSSDAEVLSMVDKVVAELGGLDLLINNAGITRPVELTNLEGITDDDFAAIFAVNVRGLFYCCRAAIPQMLSAGHGHIVNVASIAGISGTGSSLMYSASKGAVITLTRGIAASHAPQIQVNAVAPGVVETRWTEQLDPAIVERIAGTIPMQRTARPDDVAQLIVGLLGNDYVTGEVVTLAGGRAR